jgi:hypothetical protein
MKQSQQRAMIEHYIHAYNSFDVQGMMRHIQPNIMFRNIAANGETTHTANNRTEFEALACLAKEMFRERKQTLLHIQWHDDKAEVQIDFTGAIKTDIPEAGLKAGHLLHLQGISLFRFDETGIVSIDDIAT